MSEYKRAKRFRFAHFKIESYTQAQKEAFFSFVRGDFDSFRYVQAHVIAGRRSGNYHIPRCLHIFMQHERNALTERTWKSMVPERILERNWSIERVDAKARGLMDKLHDDPYNAFEIKIGTPPHQGVTHNMYKLRKKAEELGLHYSNKLDEKSLSELLETYTKDIKDIRHSVVGEYKNTISTPQTQDRYVRFSEDPTRNEFYKRSSHTSLLDTNVPMTHTHVSTSHANDPISRTDRDDYEEIEYF